MQWKGRRQSSNVNDRRGSGIKTGGISITGIIIALILWKVFGVDPATTLGVQQQMQAHTQSSAPAELTPQQMNR